MQACNCMHDHKEKGKEKHIENKSGKKGLLRAEGHSVKCKMYTFVDMMSVA